MAVFGAWHAVNLSKAKRLPSLESVMKRMSQAEGRRPQKTPEQWLAQFENLAAALGGDPLKKRPKLKAEYLKERE